jgi:CheY-like chemotaxis protein
MDGHILFVDDDKEDRFLIEHAFSELGFKDKIAFLQDGSEVMPYLDTAASDKTQLIILDLNMPVLNGTETLRLLKQHPQYRNIPVLILSTSVNHIEQENSLQLGALAFREKPARFKDYISFCREIKQLADAQA